MTKQSKRAAIAAGAIALDICAALIGAMAYETYWAPRLCQVAEPERAPALQRIEKIGSVSIAEPDTSAKNYSLPAQQAGDK